MPHNTPTALSTRPTGLGRVAALAAAICMTAFGVTIAIADDQRMPHVVPIPEQPATRYSDIEANKAASMRALGRHIATQGANGGSPYDDLAANKARSRRAR